MTSQFEYRGANGVDHGPFKITFETSDNPERALPITVDSWPRGRILSLDHDGFIEIAEGVTEADFEGMLEPHRSVAVALYRAGRRFEDTCDALSEMGYRQE